MIGYHKSCKICNCEQRADVEAMRDGGASLQQVVDYLAGYGVALSKPAVKRHFDAHFAPREEAAKRYAEKSAAVMEQAVEKRLTDLEMLDNMILANYGLHAASLSWARDAVHDRAKLPQALVQLITGLSSETRQAMKAQLEILGENAPNAIADALRGLWDDADVNDDS